MTLLTKQRVVKVTGMEGRSGPGRALVIEDYSVLRGVCNVESSVRRFPEAHQPESNSEAEENEATYPSNTLACLKWENLR
jgi:hypothetical protein